MRFHRAAVNNEIGQHVKGRELSGKTQNSALLALSGLESRLGESPEETRKPANPLRLGIQGKLTLAVLGSVLLIMICVSWYELHSGMQILVMADKTIDLTNLRTINEWTQAIFFLLRSPVIALVVAGFVILFYTSRYIVIPLRKAGEVADAIAGGDLTRRINYESHDEIGDLVKSFNIMSRSLVKKVDQLASLNQAGHAFSSNLSLDKLGETVNENIREHVRPSVVGLYTIDREDYENGVPPEGALKRAISGREYSESVIEAQNVLAMKVVESERFSQLFAGETQVLRVDLLIPGKAINSVGLPLFSGGHALGALVLTVEQSGESYTADDIEYLKVLASHISLAARNAQLYHSIEISYLDTVAALAAAVDAKDAYTRGHSERVMRNSVHLSRALSLPKQEINMIRYSALLHDVGKIGLPNHILSSKTRLTEEEFNLVKQHPVMGYEIVKPISFLRPALDGILYHHERWDGHGYPEGLAGEDIPFISRILSLSDSWDAMANDRFYRRARSTDEIMEEMLDNSATQFDPNLVPTAVEVFSAVTLQDREELALKDSVL